MSNSRKKHAISGLTTDSDKPFKVKEHRRERHHVRQTLRSADDDADPRLHQRFYGDPWNSPKDGRLVDWTSDPDAAARRK